MLLKKENTLLCIVDIQERLHPHIRANKKLTDNTKILIGGAKALKLPIVVTQQYTKGLGETIPEIREALGRFTPIEKTSFSSFREPMFAETLKQSGKSIILLAGIETHVCVQQTAIDCAEAGYTPVVIEDCVSSRKKMDRRRALKRMEQSGILISTYESVLFELLKEAGTPEFKAISALVK